MTNDLTTCVARVAEGDADALAQLYDRTRRLVYGLALRLLRRPDEAEEVTLDVYTQVWRTARRFDPIRGSVQAWLSMMVRSRAVDRLRARACRPDLAPEGTEPFDDEPPPTQDADPLADLLDARTRVEAMMRVLAPHQRRLVSLAFFEGYTHSELAERLEMPLGTVKARIRAALAAMRYACAV